MSAKIPGSFGKFFSPLLVILFFIWLRPDASAQCDGRYQSGIFEDIGVTTVKFGESPNTDGTIKELFMDIYEPSGDVEPQRPVILLAHGGAFIAGGRNSPEIKRLCNAFSRMGYVCASIEYRLASDPISLLSEEQMIKAIVMAGHDGKAAIRYFKRSFEEGNPYAIDPDQIILGGVSAGAILSLLIYVTDLNMVPWPWNVWIEELGGGLEGNSGNPGYDTDVIGIVNISGAFGKPYWINGDNIPMLHIHGVRDPIVPYGVGKPFGIPWLPNMFGSKVIHERALEAGIPSTLVTFPDRGHVPFLNFPEYLLSDDIPFINEEIYDSTLPYITEFAYSLLDCHPDNQVVTGVEEEAIDASITLYPNPTSGPLTLTVPAALTRSKVTVFATDGTAVFSQNMNGNTMREHLSLPPGMYLMDITVPGSSVASYFRRFVVVE